ncbi:MAG TPA: glycoside hydrolase family 13 protein [Bacteroidota bacterium]|nr:glycoside hydrolase family 13 protein [Bacteroidota bacterium]
MTLIAAISLAGGASAMPAAAQVRSFAPAWVQDAVFYQIFPERFCNGDTSNDPPGTEPWGGKPTTRNFFGGDLRGIISRLDYIASLGVNAIYLNPVFASGSNHKYNTRDYLRIDPAFGDEATFRELVDSAHARGIRVILDGVFNHTGTDFFAFADLKKNGARSRYAGWYNVHSFPVGPVSKPNYDCWWGFGSLPKLMTGNPAVRQYLFDVTRHWLAAGIDGWRLDVPNEIPHPFWIEWRKLVKSINPDAYILGEIWDDGSPWLGGDQFDAVMNYPFRSACVDFFASGKTSVSHFDAALDGQREAYGPGVMFSMFNLLGSHDTERFLTLCRADTALWRLALLFQMTYPGAPSLYYGDEVGMTGGKDPECRGTMVWDSAQQDGEMLRFTRDAIALRRNHSVLRSGRFAALVREDESRVYAFLREDPSSAAVVLLNRGVREARVVLPRGHMPGVRAWNQIWPGEARSYPPQGDSLIVRIPALAGVVLEGEK